MRNCKDDIIFIAMMFQGESNCSHADSRHGSLLSHFVPQFVAVLKGKTKRLRGICCSFLLRSSRPRCSWTHSIISAATPCNQSDGLRQPVTGWLIDYYPEGFALPMSGTGQAPRITGGPTEDWCLLLSLHHHFSFPHFHRETYLDTPAAAPLQSSYCFRDVWVEEETSVF